MDRTEGFDVGLIPEEPIPSLSSHLHQVSKLYELVHQFVGRWIRGLDYSCDLVYRNHRLMEQSSSNFVPRPARFPSF